MCVKETTMLIGIWAQGTNGEIGNKGDLPWKRNFPTDLKWFKWITLHYKDAVLLAGTKTAKFLPVLPGREIGIISRDNGLSLDEVRELAKERVVIIIGGGEIFKQLMTEFDIVYKTVIDQSFIHDTVVGKHFGWVVDSVKVPNMDNNGTDVTFLTILPTPVGKPIGFSDYVASLDEADRPFIVADDLVYADADEEFVAGKRILLEFTDSEYDIIERAAKKKGLEVGAFVQAALEEAVVELGSLEIMVKG